MLMAPNRLGDDVLDALPSDVLGAVSAGVGPLLSKIRVYRIGPISKPFFQGYRTGNVLTDALNRKFYSFQKAVA